MKILLDTCTFLWIGIDAPELSDTARAQFLDENNEVYLSAVSAWEIAVKHTLGRLHLPDPLERYIATRREQHGIAPLPLDEAATLQLPKLPDWHRDPFDRMLICQAIAGTMAILTPDPQIARYPIKTIW